MLLVGIIAILASLVLLFKALGIFGKQESVAAARLRPESVDVFRSS